MRLAPVFLAILAVSAGAQSTITGTVRDAGRPVESAQVHGERSGGGLVRDAVTDSAGHFRLTQLTPGIYVVTVRRVGYRSAELPNVRVADGQTLTLNVALTQAPRQLSTIEVVTSPTSIDATTPELKVRLDREYTELLPSARDASSLIALVPGARKDQLWGGAPGVSNNYQLDGVAMNHPGAGGDFLALSIDWIESLEVRGLGAGAEHGDFQGGIINAITKTGSNERQVAIRSNYEAESLTASNFNANELGVEQAGRVELGAEALGPISRDRLFYFVGGQYVSRHMRSPDLTSVAPLDYQPVREAHIDARGIAKLTWLPALGQRVDVLGGFSSNEVEHAGINGVDDASATVHVREPTAYYELSWTNSSHARHVIDARIAGFSAAGTRAGYAGPATPGVQILQAGRMPSFQNAAFDERRDPRSLSGQLDWRTTQHVAGAEHELVLGTEITRTRWRDERTRNGGLTWRPYSFGVSNFDPTDARSWGTVGSDWGGEMRLDSDMGSEAVFAQDHFTLGTRVTVSPGVRYGHWTGYIRPHCGADTAAASCYRFDAVHAEGFDPRVGIVWDVTGRNTFAVKAHFGRYHQGMYALFFDRVAGANVYTNSRFYYLAPPVTNGTQTFTVAQRDAPNSGFSPFYDEQILNESGRVEHYRQPYVDQAVLAVEKTFGARWKGEVVYTHRRNGDIVGLKDMNELSNYSPVFDVSVNHRLVGGSVLDPQGNPLVLPYIYVANDELREQLVLRRAALRAGRGNNPYVAGYDTSLIDNLKWNPDVVLTTVPEAKRNYDQLTLMLRAYESRWRAEGSITGARLRGNVPGVTGYGTTGSRFSAGPFVRPNELINADGYLPDALQLEGKLWLTARLPASMSAGVLYTHVLGERFTPRFEILGRYDYSINFEPLPSDLFHKVLGQSVFVEPRGSRQYASRDIVDAHLEWRARPQAVLQFDLFNVLGTDALTSINENIGDQTPTDPTSFFAAPRLRVAPRTLRVGLRLEQGAR